MMENQVNKLNSWGILNIFTSYLKHNRAIIISTFALPLVFILAISINYKTIIGKNNFSPALIIMLLWIMQSASFAIQTFLTILLDFKQSAIYRHIGLTQINKVKFLFISSIFNLVMTILSNFFIILVILTLALIFKENTLIAGIFNWKMLLAILFTIACLILLTSIAILMSSLIKTRTGQTISSVIVNFLVIIPLFILIFFLNTLSNNTNHLITNIGTKGITIIFINIFILINLISFFFYYLSCRVFSWTE